VAVCIYQFLLFIPDNIKHVVSDQTYNCPHNNVDQDVAALYNISGQAYIGVISSRLWYNVNVYLHHVGAVGRSIWESFELHEQSYGSLDYRIAVAGQILV